MFKLDADVVYFYSSDTITMSNENCKEVHTAKFSIRVLIKIQELLLQELVLYSVVIVCNPEVCF